MPDNIPIEIIEEDAHALVLKTRQHFIQLREKAGYDKAWKAAEESYFNGTDDYYKGQAKVRIPALHQAVERIVPKMDKVLFPPDGEFIALSAKDPDNTLEQDAALAATALTKQQFIEIKAREKLIGVYRSLCTYGTVFLKTYWNHIEKEKFVRNGNKREREVFTTFDNPDFYSPSIWDIYADPKDENLEGAVIERIMMDYSDLLKLRVRKEDDEEVGIYKNVDKIKGMFFKREGDDDKQVSEEIRGLGGHEYGPHENKVQLFEYWGPVPKYFFTHSYKDKESLETVDNCLIVIASTADSNSNTNGNAVCLRISECPFDYNEKPYLRGRYIKVDGRLYGLGVMSVSISLEAELNTIRNQLMDMRTFMLKNKWLRDKNSEISDWQLQDLSNLVIDTNDMQGLKALVPPDFSGSALANEGVIKQDIYDATGATPLLSGTPSGGSLDRTAAGIATVVSGGLERFELVITLFSEEILKRLVERNWQLNQQFLPEGRDIRLTGKPIVKVVPEEIPFNFELNFLGTREIGEKEFKINALNILLQNLAPYIPLGLDPIPVVLKFFKLTGMGELEKEVDMRPNTQLENTPEGELQLLQMGRKVKIDLNDDHDSYIAAYITLLKQPKLPDNVVANTKEALGQRIMAKKMLSEIQRQLITPKVPEQESEETGENAY
jgi:hypothetical protein